MTVALFSASGARAAETAGVVVTIKPLHALVSGVIGDTGKATLLVTGNTSPHGFKFKPSQMTALNNAKIVFLIDEHFETFMESALDVIPQAVIKSAVIEEARLKLLPFRKGGVWEEDDHEGHDHGDAHGDEANLDMHAWLDPDRAIKMVKAITRELSDLYPENRDTYKANARAYIAKIKTLDAEIAQSLAAVNQHRFIVFHDAYQYFEKRFGISTAGALTLNTDVLPGAKQISEIQAVIEEKGIKCIFSEPQFNPKIIDTIAEDTGIKTGILDPLGSTYDANKEQYFKLIKDLGNNLQDC